MGVSAPTKLTPAERRRFARQLPVVGEAGQASLCAATSFVPAGDEPENAWHCRYLERAGVAVTRGGDARGMELPHQVVGDETPLPELIGALRAAEALLAALEDTP